MTTKKASSSVPSSIGGESSAMGAKLEQQTPILYTPPRAIKDVPVSAWEFWSREGDDSAVTAVNYSNNSKKTTITINDPKHNEQLIVTVNSDPYLHFEDVTDMAYDDYIQKRQQDDRDAGSNHHIFAKTLDYVIQCAGKLVPFLHDGSSDQPRDRLIASVRRINTQTSKETLCRAEYTFYKTGDKSYLYHRLLRPINQ